MHTDHVTESAGKKAGTKPRARAKAVAKPKTLRLKAQPATVASSPEELAAMIATAAYFCAEHRGFQPGHELEDWLAAEQQVRTVYPS